MDIKRATRRDCEIPYIGELLPIWRELLWGLEWVALRSSRVYRGLDVQRGNGDPVIVVPGFLASDAQLFELESWLGRVGYRPAPSGLGYNMDCPDVLLAELTETMESVRAITGTRIRLIGHSLGGTLARAAAIRRPDLVAQVITLGSPLREVIAHPLVLTVARVLQAYLPSPDDAPRKHGDHFHGGSCSCSLLEALSQPFPSGVSRTAIYSRLDGVVAWRSAVEPDSRLNAEVRATHLGLIVDEDVYRLLARLLASVSRRQTESGTRKAA